MYTFHTPLENFMTAGFVLKTKEKDTSSIQGNKPQPIIRRHTCITWIEGPTPEANRLNSTPIINQEHQGPPGSDSTKGEAGSSQAWFGQSV
ncbi:hypothetical protein C2845_PM01G42030 [Panicum miliaceum]|uniref:Uncharacterized protein n=1 Tax=Panicum miliaceum TaxID=4540 RepID=A0A3L6TN38_PANMI|nr:hypothetical protein C2845_PM01G42030 [Panicum miliaceum]